MIRNIGVNFNSHQLNFGLKMSYRNVPDSIEGSRHIESETERLSRQTGEPAKAFWYRASSGSQDHMDVLIITGQNDIDAEEKRREEEFRARFTPDD